MTVLNNTILIKFSNQTEQPASLLAGELAYSQLSGKLWIGEEGGQVVEIGGAALVARVGGLENLVSQLQTLVGDNHTELQDLIEAIDGRVDELETFRTTTEQKLAEIESDVSDIDLNGLRSDLESQIAGERSARQQAVDGLGERITNAEQNLNTSIDNVATQVASKAELVEVQAANDRIDAEISLRGSEDQAIRQSISELTQSTADQFTQEREDRADAVSGVQSNVDAVSQDLEALEQEIDQDLQNLHQTISSEIESAVDAEAASRAADVATLRGEIADSSAGAIDSALNTARNASFGQVVVTDLTVTGTTTTVNSDVTTIKDPVIVLGAGSAVADGMSRGVKYEYVSAADNQPKTGFFGVQTGGVFDFIPEVLQSADENGEFQGTKGTIRADLEGNSQTASKLAQQFMVSFAGEVSGTAQAVDGSADIVFDLTANGAVEADDSSIVRRDVDGSVKANNLVAKSASSEIKGYIINGGTF